jgi:hypothetical protein
MQARLVIVLSCAIACGGKSTEPAAPAADCKAAVENAMGLSAAELKKAIPSITDARIAEVKAASITRCTEDGWSGETRNCMAASRTRDDVVKCEQRNTPEQRDKLAHAIAAAAGMTEPAGSGSDPASDAGSAGSGSAK